MKAFYATCTCNIGQQRVDRNFFLLENGSIASEQAGISTSRPNAEVVNGQRVVARETYLPWIGAVSNWLKSSMRTWRDEEIKHIEKTINLLDHAPSCYHRLCAEYGRAAEYQEALKRYAPRAAAALTLRGIVEIDNNLVHSYEIRDGGADAAVQSAKEAWAKYKRNS